MPFPDNRNRHQVITSLVAASDHYSRNRKRSASDYKRHHQRCARRDSADNRSGHQTAGISHSGTPTIILTIVNALPQIITSIVNAITQNIPMIVQAGITLLTSLITNLPTISKIVKAMPQIISGIVSALGNGVSQLADVGKISSKVYGTVFSRLRHGSGTKFPAGRRICGTASAAFSESNRRRRSSPNSVCICPRVSVSALWMR